MDDIRCPAKLLHCFENASCEEDRSFAIVLEEFAVVVAVNALAMEIVLVVDEIYLHSRCRYRCDLDHERSVHFVDHDVHAGKSDHLVELILSFVDASVAWHE